MRLLKSCITLLFITTMTTASYAADQSVFRTHSPENLYTTIQGNKQLPWMPPCQIPEIHMDVLPSPDATGMSHSGIDITLKNTSAKTCYIRGISHISFVGKWHERLNIQPILNTTPSTTHTPLALAPKDVDGDTATMTLRWVSNEVFDENQCLDPISIRFRDGGLRLKASMKAHICGEKGKPLTFEQQELHFKTSQLP